MLKEIILHLFQFVTFCLFSFPFLLAQTSNKDQAGDEKIMLNQSSRLEDLHSLNLICLMAYQFFMVYLMLEFNSLGCFEVIKIQYMLFGFHN